MLLRVTDHFGGFFSFLFIFLAVCNLVVAEAGCTWYLLDINIFPLSKKSLK
jgi:hypothetical protein